MLHVTGNRIAKIKNLNFWKCLEISKKVATSGSRKLLLALYFFFFCTLYTFLNHVYLPGPFNFYFLNLLQILLWALHTFLGVFGPLWDRRRPLVAHKLWAEWGPGRTTCALGTFLLRLKSTLQLYHALPFSVITKKHILKATKAQSNQND